MEDKKPLYKSINPNAGSLINLEQAKLPPQALDLEEAVLGAMLIDKKGVDEVIDILQPEVFYKIAHQNIFQAILILFEWLGPILISDTCRAWTRIFRWLIFRWGCEC